MSCLLPKAPDINAYWDNILNKVNATVEVPEDQWDWKLYFDSDRKARDKIYSRWGGFLDPMPFDPVRYGMPPKSLASIEPVHLLTLETVQAALKDAGYADRPFSRERTSVIMGVSSAMPDLGQQYVFRSKIPMFFKDISPKILDRLPEWTEDSFPGILSNVTAGRVANQFDLGGFNYTVDAACAASLAALHLAVRELEGGISDMVILGGGDTNQNSWAFLCFSKTPALSPTGETRTFDETADGIVLGEGIAVLVLKRRADAERDGDRIYAVIKGVGGSSDGRAKGLTAPWPAGQKRALDRAYAKARLSPATLDLVEAHGTGTVAGDKAEIDTLKQVFDAAGAIPGRCALGSVKTMIGHLKATAGAASLTKTVLALHHKVLPPTLGVTTPNSALVESPFYVNSEARPWVARADGEPRRAGVSAFGFGGTNFHAVLEEYRGDFLDDSREAVLPRWPVELFTWTGESREELVSKITSFTEALEKGAKPAMRDLAYSLWLEARDLTGIKLAVVATSLDDLGDKLTRAREKLADSPASEALTIHDPRGIYLTEQPLAQEGKVAFLFSGQGSQYPDMIKDLTIHFGEARHQMGTADRVLKDQFPQPLSRFIFPPPRFSKEETKACREALTRTHVTQPALGASSMGILSLLQALQLEPDLVAGHSYGEYVALRAAGVFDDETLYKVSEVRGRFIQEAAGGGLGGMAAVKATPEIAESILESVDGAWVANLNSPEQTIISGSLSAIDEALPRFKEEGYGATKVPVSCPFHSPLMAPVQERFAEFLETVDFGTPGIEVFSNTYAAPYPKDPDGISSILKEHLIRPVKFGEEIEAMYEAGARVFVEVGPRNVLTNLTQQTLGDRPYLAVATDMADRSGLLQLHHALGQLVAHGVSVELDRLYRTRGVRKLDLEDLVKDTEEPPLSPTTWMVNGKGAWPLGSEEPGSGMTAPTPDLAMTEPGVEKRPAAPPTPTAEKRDPSVPAPGPAPTPASSGPRSEDGEVMLRFQQLMSRFLEVQQQVMLAHLQGGTAEGGALAAQVSDLEKTSSDLLAGMPAAPPATAPNSAEPAEAAAAVVPTPPAEPPATGKLEEVTAHILEVVSERTGYPPDMLDLDLDVEADLGIDSIKRVEILGTIMEAHFADREEMDQETMEELNTRKTLRSIIDWIAEALGDEGQGAAPGDAPAQPAGEPAAASKLEAVTSHILEVVSERTGYPPDMLDLDLDVEADLGIDSIKRVEILGTIMEAHFADREEMDQETMEELNTRKTLRSIIDWIAEALGDEGQGAAPGDAPAQPAGEPAAASKLEAVTSHILEVVSERTGYPPDMLDLDLDVEADLGIDSIKRVEILGTIMEAHFADREEMDQETMEELNSRKTLRSIIDWVSDALSSQP